MRMSHLSARRATAIAMASSVAVAGLLSSGCTPTSTGGTKVISGTIQGADGKIVDVLMGFDVLDAYGRKMNLGGGPGYSAMQRLNHCVPTYGANASQRCSFNGVTTQITGKNWSIRLPASAVRVYVEVYPKAPTPTAWLNNYRGYTGIAAGSTNTSTYGLTYKRDLSIGAGLSNVSIVLPKVCSAGGNTGSLVGHINGWPAGAVGKVNAWSMASNTLATQGFGMGTVNGAGNYRIDNLATGQRYGLIASGGGFSRNVVNFYNATHNDTVIPGACAVRGYNF